ncbi:MAG: hypothetical protein V4555_10810 [Acidobacteriota bacterium]
MEEELQRQLDRLARALTEFEKTSKKALGFVGTIEHSGISFDVSKRFVIADMSPIAFFHLVEHIEEDGAAAAVLRLYERMGPLLECRHKWTPLKREDDWQVLQISYQGREGNSPHICKSCTAYALNGALPEVGRGR